MKRLATCAAIALFALGSGTIAASADSCSGHNHNGATAAGAGGGALIGGLATHSVVGAVVGGVGGALVGNSIARSSDCNRHSSYSQRRYHDSYRHADYYIDRDGHRHYYHG